MNGMKRALRHYLLMAEEYFGLSVLGAFAMALYASIINYNTNTFEDFVTMIAGSLVMIIAIVIFVTGVNGGQNNYGLLVSFGCIRRHALFGNFIMNFLLIVQTGIYYFLWGTVFDYKIVLLPAVTAVLFLIAGFAQIMGIAVMKWGKIAYTFCVIICVLTAMMFGMFIVILGRTDVAVYGELFDLFLGQKYAAVHGELAASFMRWMIVLPAAGICVVLYLVGYIWIVRHYEVKI